jgi:hypothetical protein
VPTVTLNMVWAYQNLVGIPRLAAVEHPFGRPFGDVEDAGTQRAVLWSALQIVENATEPGQIDHLPFVWHQHPKETDWHPAEPSPVIAWFKEQMKKKK